jgi:hypothetical protein
MWTHIQLYSEMLYFLLNSRITISKLSNNELSLCFSKCLLSWIPFGAESAGWMDPWDVGIVLTPLGIAWKTSNLAKVFCSTGSKGYHHPICTENNPNSMYELIWMLHVQVFPSCKVKVKLSLCSPWAPRHEGVLGSGGTAPPILRPRH